MTGTAAYQRIVEQEDWDTILEHDESITWTGGPSTAFRAEGRSLSLTILAFIPSIATSGILSWAFAMYIMPVPMDALIIIWLYLVPAQLLLFLVAYVLYRHRKRQSTAYVLTNKRAMVLANWPFKHLKAFALGVGTDIIMHHSNPPSFYFKTTRINMGKMNGAVHDGFDFVEDADQLIKKLGLRNGHVNG